MSYVIRYYLVYDILGWLLLLCTYSVFFGVEHFCLIPTRYPVWYSIKQCLHTSYIAVYLVTCTGLYVRTATGCVGCGCVERRRQKQQQQKQRFDSDEVMPFLKFGGWYLRSRVDGHTQVRTSIAEATEWDTQAGDTLMRDITCLVDHVELTKTDTRHKSGCCAPVLHRPQKNVISPIFCTNLRL